MIDVKCFTVNMLQENCYVVSDESRQAVVIDCGAFYESEQQAIVAYLNDNRLTPCHLLCTHGHMDHVFGVEAINAAYGLQPEIHADDEELLLAVAEQTETMLGIDYEVKIPPVGRRLADGDVVSFGSHELHVVHTPGHSPGSVVFYCEQEGVLFSGDTLFRMSVGRTDLHRGSWPQLMDSLARRIAPLPPDTMVYTGHGPTTTIGEELRTNPFLR